MLIREKLETLITNNKIYACILIVFVLGLFMVSGCTEKEDNSLLPEKDTARTEYSLNDELRLENILSEIKGIGKIKILINESSGNEFSTETIFKKSDDENVDKNYIGVIVAAEGADDPSVSNTIKESISTFLGIPLHKIVVYRMI